MTAIELLIGSTLAAQGHALVRANAATRLPEVYAPAFINADMINLTPGDFAAVVRQHRFLALESATEFVAALRPECAVKQGSRAKIGFC